MFSPTPTARGNTLLQCLEIHEYFQFIDLVMIANLTYLLNSTDQKITVFAPPDVTLDSFNLSSMEAAAQFVLSHIVQGEVLAEDILYNTELTSLSGGSIFTSTVEIYHYRYIDCWVWHNIPCYITAVCVCGIAGVWHC